MLYNLCLAFCLCLSGGKYSGRRGSIVFCTQLRLSETDPTGQPQRSPHRRFLSYPHRGPLLLERETETVCLLSRQGRLVALGWKRRAERGGRAWCFIPTRHCRAEGAAWKGDQHEAAEGASLPGRAHAQGHQSKLGALSLSCIWTVLWPAFSISIGCFSKWDFKRGWGNEGLAALQGPEGQQAPSKIS